MAVTKKDFFEQIDSFIDYRKKIYEVSTQTIKSNLYDLKLFKNFINEKNYELINGPAVMDFQYHLKQDRKNSGNSINRKIFALRSYGNFLRLQNVPSAENLPFYDVLKVRQGYRNCPNALTHNQIKLFFDTIDRSIILGIRDYAVYALMYQTGLRVGEVFSLNPESINFKNKKLVVIGKGKKRRDMHLTDEILQILSEWIAVRSYFCNSKNNDALFISKKGNRLAIRTMEDNFKKIVLTAGLKTHFNITCHTFRHTFASHLNDEDVDILVIQSLMGHASPRSTHPYIHPSHEKIRQAMERLPGVIFMNKLIESRAINLKFQASFKKKRE